MWPWLVLVAMADRGQHSEGRCKREGAAPWATGAAGPSAAGSLRLLPAGRIGARAETPCTTRHPA